MPKPPKKDYKRFDSSDLKPVTEEDRKRLFPNGPVSYKQLKANNSKTLQKQTNETQTS